MDAIHLETEALSLSPLERARLADKLLNSLSDHSLDPVLVSWIHLAEERLVAHHRGNSADIEGPTYLAQLRKRYAT